VATLTLCSVPPAAVTVIPFDGLAPLAPFPGVIVTTGPAGDGFAVAEAWPLAAAPLAPAFSMMVVLLPVQAVAAATSAPAATAETTRIALMQTL
jgi:hypothetical protein